MIATLRSHPFSLVLSGGGALGIAHLGLLHDLEKAALKPAQIVGTSMGGIIGACVATGMSEQEILRNVQQFAKIINWVQFSFSGNAVVQTQKIETIFTTLFGSLTCKAVAIPLKLIATNLHDGSKRVFSQDDDILLKDALLATMAIPGIFEAPIIEGVHYGDGFLCENLGIKEACCEHVLAVDVLGRHAFDAAMPDSFFKTKNVLEMFERSMRLLIYNQSRHALRHTDKKVILIEPDTKAFKTYHFHKSEAIRLQGLGLLH